MIVKVRSGRFSEVVCDEISVNTLAPGPYRNEVLGLVMEMAQTLGPEVYIRQSRAMQRRKDQQATLRRCKVPALVLCVGRMTRFIPSNGMSLWRNLSLMRNSACWKTRGICPCLNSPTRQQPPCASGWPSLMF